MERIDTPESDFKSDLFDFDTPSIYPDHPGSKAKTGPSVEAARAIAPGLKSGQRAVLDEFKAAFPDALGTDEVAVAIRRNPLYVRPRVSELARLGFLVPTPRRRTNSSGLSAGTWRASESVMQEGGAA